METPTKPLKSAAIGFNAEDVDIVSIANLDPTILPPSNVAIKARVALVYPYSSSTQSAGILAADPDIRARRNGGQVHVQLKGAAAKCVGSSGIGIGDVIHLSLNGAIWVEDRNAARAPGRSVHGALLYDTRLNVKVGIDNIEYSWI